MSYRIEKDSMGEVKVPSDKLWGAQTERSRRNFKIGGQLMPSTVIRSLVLIKKCCAVANWKADKLTKIKKEAIVSACDKILAGDFAGNFPLVVWQTGSGTQSNMNVNEVIANIGAEAELHSNDDVNMSQSSNDVFPSAIHIASVMMIEYKLIPAIEKLIISAKRLEAENAGIVKVGRTHLQDAIPIAFSSEVSGWRAMLTTSLEMIKANMYFVKRLAIGGTAVGSGINTPKNFTVETLNELNKETNLDFCEDENKYHALSSRDALCNMHGVLKTLAVNLMKIANDVRMLASGPRAGLGEITIPENEPGSSIMPGKVNPTQCESMTMIASEVMGNDVTVSVAAAGGNFELNVFMPVIAFKMMESIQLLSDSIESFDKNCFSGIKANTVKMKENLDNSLMVATALTPYIGYENTTVLVRYAYENNLDLYQANDKLALLDNDKLKRVLEAAVKI
ncbi:MAG TPA: class II fumarate hydratase [Clostridia bacterium]|nr:class II fumarate hydratase [Clostridia bacterium]